MPAITIDAYYSAYEERADLAYQFPEWGTNRFGQTSHAIRPGDGAQYDSSRANTFFNGGITQSIGNTSIGCRSMSDNVFEGPHITQGVAVFQVPLKVTLTSAFLHFYCSSGWNVVNGSNYAFRIYVVDEDNYSTRWLGDQYHITNKQEFSRAQNGPGGCKFRVDSHEADMRHATEQLRWEVAVSGFTAAQVSPDIKAPINQVMARTGWKSGSRLALILAPDTTAINSSYATGFAPDWTQYPAGNTAGAIGCNGDGSHANKLQLELNY